MTDSLSKMRRLPWLPMLLAFAVSALFVGCEETVSTGTVRGKVTLDDAPYADAAVVFMSPDSGQAATADIQPDGTFSIQTPLPVGSYVVFLAPKSAASEQAGDQPVEESIDESVPEMYLNEATSDITFEVVEGENDFTVPLHK
jgi:hypothetical protein